MLPDQTTARIRRSTLVKSIPRRRITHLPCQILLNQDATQLASVLPAIAIMSSADSFQVIGFVLDDRIATAEVGAIEAPTISARRPPSPGASNFRLQLYVKGKTKKVAQYPQGTAFLLYDTPDSMVCAMRA